MGSPSNTVERCMQGQRTSSVESSLPRAGFQTSNQRAVQCGASASTHRAVARVLESPNRRVRGGAPSVAQHSPPPSICAPLSPRPLR